MKCGFVKWFTNHTKLKMPRNVWFFEASAELPKLPWIPSTRLSLTYTSLGRFGKWFLWGSGVTLPETNSSPMKIPIFPGKYHQNGGFSMAMFSLPEGILAKGRWIAQTPKLMKNDENHPCIIIHPTCKRRKWHVHICTGLRYVSVPEQSISAVV